MGSEHQPDPRSRRRSIAIASLGATLVAVAVIAALVTFGTDDQPSTSNAGGGTTASTAAADESSVSASPTSAPTDGTAADDDVATGGTEVSVPVGPISGGNEGEICAAILDRIGEYQRITGGGAVPDVALAEGLGEFEDEIYTLADNQDWGDRIIEQLTTVRREWATAAAARDAGDSAEAASRIENASSHLAAAIGTAACPTE